MGAGSPVISTSRRSLFPATTIIVFWETMFPVVSRWIFGGSVLQKKEILWIDVENRDNSGYFKATYLVWGHNRS